jgi:hypothetical protein
MGFQNGWRGPNIVSDGLVLYLDAGSPNSYRPDFGTTWKDMSGFNNPGSLINGPTYNSANGGSIMFDGVDDYVSCGNSNTLQVTIGTVSAWIKTTNPGSGYRGIITKQLSWGFFAKDGVLMMYDWGSSVDRSTGVNIADGNWKNISLTFTETIGSPSNNAIMYLNGISIFTTTVKFLNNTVEVQLGRGGDTGGSTQLLNGTIAAAHVYNRILSPQEILQNYNALKSRFNL